MAIDQIIQAFGRMPEFAQSGSPMGSLNEFLYGGDPAQAELRRLATAAAQGELFPLPTGNTYTDTMTVTDNPELAADNAVMNSVTNLQNIDREMVKAEQTSRTGRAKSAALRAVSMFPELAYGMMPRPPYTDIINQMSVEFDVSASEITSAIEGLGIADEPPPEARSQSDRELGGSEDDWEYLNVPGVGPNANVAGVPTAQLVSDPGGDGEGDGLADVLINDLIDDYLGGKMEGQDLWNSIIDSYMDDGFDQEGAENKAEEALRKRPELVNTGIMDQFTKTGIGELKQSQQSPYGALGQSFGGYDAPIITLNPQDQYEIMARKQLGNVANRPEMESALGNAFGPAYGKFVLQVMMQPSIAGDDTGWDPLYSGDERWNEHVTRGFQEKADVFYDADLQDKGWKDLVNISSRLYSGAPGKLNDYESIKWQIALVDDWQVAAARARGNIDGRGIRGTIRANAFEEHLRRYREEQSTAVGEDRIGLAAWLAKNVGGPYAVSTGEQARATYEGQPYVPPGTLEGDPNKPADIEYPNWERRQKDLPHSGPGVRDVPMGGTAGGPTERVILPSGPEWSWWDSK